MAEMSRRFNFDDFDEQVREALEENDARMASLLAVNSLARVLRPGETGAVKIYLDLPPEAV